MENNSKNQPTSKKMYLTAAEAEKMNLPSNEEQIARWNKLQKQIRKGR